MVIEVIVGMVGRVDILVGIVVIGMVGRVGILVGIMRRLAQGPGPPGILHCTCFNASTFNALCFNAIIAQNLPRCHFALY